LTFRVAASKNGHLKVIKYLIEVQKKDCTKDAIVYAMKYGHLEVVKYLKSMKNRKVICF